MLRFWAILAFLTFPFSAFAQSSSSPPTPTFSPIQQSVPAKDAMSRIKNSTLSGECRYKPKDAPCGCGSDNFCVGVCDGFVCKILK
jgi:hypothetical protein